MKIFLDPGHGGTDPGAIGNGIKEKDINLDICKRIQTGLKLYKDCEVMMSRETDIAVALLERTKQANNWDADVLLSVHINAATSAAANGFESFVYIGSGSATIAYQNVMHQEVLKAMGAGITDRGKSQKNLHMLRESKMKAILTENLFISNASNASKLADPNFLQKIADGHIIGLEKFLGLKRAALPPPTATKLYKVQVGAFEEKENATALYNDLIKNGYRPAIIFE